MQKLFMEMWKDKVGGVNENVIEQIFLYIVLTKTLVWK